MTWVPIFCAFGCHRLITETRFASDEIFKRTSDTYRRIRNTARFLLANLAGFEPTTDLVESADLLPLDRWIVSDQRLAGGANRSVRHLPVPPRVSQGPQLLQR